MIKEIETHCEDVICTAHNSLNLTSDAFMKVCDATTELTSGQQQQLVDSKQDDIGEKIDPDEEEKKDTVSQISSSSKRSQRTLLSQSVKQTGDVSLDKKQCLRIL